MAVGSHAMPSEDSEDLEIEFARADLCRAIKVTDVLGSVGRVLRGGCAGNPSDYALSRQVAMIDAFLSHSWQSSWWKKYMAILLHFNETKATIVSNVAVVLAVVGQVQGVLPVYCFEDVTERTAGDPWAECPDSENLRADGVWCCVVGWATYLICLVMGQRLSTLCCVKPMAFLDKVCIQQCGEHVTIDPSCPLCQVKYDGICALGAFLRRSRKLMILYADCYFQRLWCCYEFACFLALNHIENIEILPLARPVIILLLWLSSLVLVLGHWFRTTSSEVGDKGFFSLTFLCLFALVWLLRAWVIERGRIGSRLRNFNVWEAKCMVESDRALVLSRIANWSRTRVSTRSYSRVPALESSSLGSGSDIVKNLASAATQSSGGRIASRAALGLVSARASEAEAIEAFNRFVRKEGPRALKRCMGNSVLRYSSLVAVLSSFMWRSLDWVSANLAIGRYSSADAIVKVVEAATAIFILMPLCIESAAKVAGHFPELPLGRSVAFCALIAMGTAALVAVATVAMNTLSAFLRDKDTKEGHRLQFIWIYLVLDLLGLLLLLLLKRSSALSAKSRPWAFALGSTSSFQSDCSATSEDMAKPPAEPTATGSPKAGGSGSELSPRAVVEGDGSDFGTDMEDDKVSSVAENAHVSV